MASTTYTVHVGPSDEPHTTDSVFVAEAYATSGVRVTAEATP